MAMRGLTARRLWTLSLTTAAAWATMLRLEPGCINRVARNVNPCGTILDCDPLEYDLLYLEYPDWERDPTCTIPGLCGGQWPPTTNAVGTAGTGTTAATTTTTTGQVTTAGTPFF